MEPRLMEAGTSLRQLWRALFVTASRGSTLGCVEYPPHAPSSYIAIEFGIQGPALSVSSNCCTGIDAINEGFQHIAEGSSSVAVVGGCDAPIFPLSFGAFCALGALTKRNDAPQKASRPYDALRDGIVVVKAPELSSSKIWSSPRNAGRTSMAKCLGTVPPAKQSACGKATFPGKRMASAITGAIHQAGLTPRDIDHVNSHGSSLLDYDICDTNAFKEALGYMHTGSR